MGEVKYRHEYKYMIDAVQKELLLMQTDGVMQMDGYAQGEGQYLIRSLYFDSPEDDCFYENEDGEDPREKYRIRFYNCDAGRIRLECKAKRRMMTRKTSCPITVEQCRAFARGVIPEPKREISPVQEAMFAGMRLKCLRPAVIVQYVRIPYVNEAGNVRITYDDSIASSGALEEFLEKDIPLRSVLPKGKSILEIKWDEFLPSYIRERLNLESLQWTSFSKYYICRKYNCYGGMRI